MPTLPLPSRVFGKVDEYGGELAASTFLHLWFVPLIPTGSVWITSSAMRPVARRTTWNWRSIVAGYLRTWVPLLWWSCFSVDTAAGYGAAAAALALCIWSWTWRMAHLRRKQLRHDFDLVALGSQCPPERLREADYQPLLAHKQRQLATINADRTPEDIARFGSADAEELLAAYAVLRLTAARRFPSGPWRIAAQRIIDGRHDPADEHEGVFRARGAHAAPPLSASELATQVHARARSMRARAVLSAARAPKSGSQQILWGSRAWIGYGAITLSFIGGVAGLRATRDPDQYEIITERRLRDTIGVGKTTYRVECSSLQLFVSASELGGDGPDVYLCQLGATLVPVLSEGGEGIRDLVVRGRLVPRHVFRARIPRWEQLLTDSPYDVQTPVVYLVTRVLSRVGQLLLSLTFLLGAVGLLALWERVRRQRRRMIAEATAVATSGASPR